jgi:hypothetical protein
LEKGAEDLFFALGAWFSLTSSFVHFCMCLIWEQGGVAWHGMAGENLSWLEQTVVLRFLWIFFSTMSLSERLPCDR